jgi:assimilatory nitrate reductase catalytic subunit
MIQRRGRLTRELHKTAGPGRLGLVPERLKPDKTTDLVCGYCSTGCSLHVHLQDRRAVNLTASPSYPVNRGHACPKGWEALTPLSAKDRAVEPLLRDGKGRMVPVSWGEAMRTFASRFRAVQKRHGPESVAFLGTGQIVCEELALLGALAKFGMGMVHGDGNTRQCMATAVVAYKEAFGFDAPPYTYADLEQSDVIILWGSNMCIAHPIMWQRVCRNPHRPTIVVIDPRRTETAMVASRHLGLRPKSDLHLIYGVARLLIERNWIDRDYIRAHTEQFAEFADHVDAYTLERVSQATGLDANAIVELATIIHNGARVSFWWTMGVNQSHEGVRTAQGLINLALMTGNIGRPGTGPNSVTGQCNAMGSRLFSNTTNLLGGHDFANPEHRHRVSHILGIDEARIPQRTGWAYDQIFEGILAGHIRGLWVVATNPAHSWINQLDVRAVFERLEFLVVQDMYTTTETAQFADLLLPAAGWGEKEGTFINSERRIGRVRRVATPPGAAMTDFDIFRLIADYWGCTDMFADWSTPEKVFGILCALTRGQPCDISGIGGYDMLDELGGVQWPLAQGQPLEAAERRLFEDGRFFTPSQRARFYFAEPTALPEGPSRRYPLLLNTGRGSSAQWHTQSRTAKSPLLRRLAPEGVYVEISPDDARTIGIKPNDMVRISSARGSIRARAFITPTVQPGEVFVPMHYATTNQLTFPSFDPYSRQPAYKACAVAVERIESWDPG